MSTTDAMKAAKKRYKQKVKRVVVEMYPTDQDILDYLEASGKPTATVVKEALREAMKRNA